MKFCTKCGHEMLDDAVLCTGCGCMVESIAPRNRVRQKATGSDNSSTLITVFNFVFSVLTTLSLFCLVLSFTGGYVYSYLYNSYSSYVSSYFYNYFPFALLMLVFAIAAFAFAIAIFVITLVKRMRLEYNLSSISRLIIGLLIFLASIAVIFNT